MTYFGKKMVKTELREKERRTKLKKKYSQSFGFPTDLKCAGDIITNTKIYAVSGLLYRLFLLRIDETTIILGYKKNLARFCLRTSYCSKYWALGTLTQNPASTTLQNVSNYQKQKRRVFLFTRQVRLNWYLCPLRTLIFLINNPN